MRRSHRINMTRAMREQQARRLYEQILNEANILFWFGISLATVGFMLVCCLMISAYIADAKLLFGVFPAAAVEAFAGLLLKQASKTLNAATALYDKFRMDQWRADAIIIANSIDDPDRRDAVRAQLALRITRQISSAEYPEVLQLNTKQRSCQTSGTPGAF